MIEIKATTLIGRIPGGYVEHRLEKAQTAALKSLDKYRALGRIFRE